MSTKIEIQNLPVKPRKNSIEEELAEIYRKNDIVFRAVSSSFARGEKNRKSDMAILSSLIETVERAS